MAIKYGSLDFTMDIQYDGVCSISGKKYRCFGEPVRIREAVVHQDAAVTGATNTMYIGRTSSGSDERLVSITMPTTYPAHKVQSIALGLTGESFAADEQVYIESDNAGSGTVNVDVRLFCEYDIAEN